MLTLRYDASQGVTYEDQYSGFLAFFKQVAETKLVTVVGVPPSWEALCWYLGAELNDPSYHLDAILAHQEMGRLREYVEHMCTLRPELVDALYQSDVVWDTVGRRHQTQREFVVTSSSSYQRPEVLEYLARLDAYRPTKTQCVLVPCAADKPYPAPLHRAVRGIVPHNYELIIATGVLGLVPESLWGVMPLYDSGIPNEWRLMKTVERYFTKHIYSHVVVYCDYYNEAIRLGLNQSLGGRPASSEWAAFINPNCSRYLNLLAPERLRALAKEVRRAD